MTPRPNALIFAASGAIAAGAARALARNGFTVHLSARRPEPLAGLKAEIESDGGSATTAIVDATHEADVRAYVDAVVAEHGPIHTVFNGIGGRPSELAYPKRVSKLSVAEFLQPIDLIVGSQFLTARIAGETMARTGGGVIVLLTATLSTASFAHMTGITTAMTAVEGLGRALSADFGPSNIRVNVIRGSAMPETRTIQETFAGIQNLADGPSPQSRSLTVADTADAVAFLASASASAISGQVVTVATGSLV